MKREFNKHIQENGFSCYLKSEGEERQGIGCFNPKHDKYMIKVEEQIEEDVIVSRSYILNPASTLSLAEFQEYYDKFAHWYTSLPETQDSDNIAIYGYHNFGETEI